MTVAVSAEDQSHYPRQYVEGLELLSKGIEKWKIKVDSQDKTEELIYIGRHERISDHIHQLSGTIQSEVKATMTPASCMLVSFYMDLTNKTSNTNSNTV